MRHKSSIFASVVKMSSDYLEHAAAAEDDAPAESADATESIEPAPAFADIEPSAADGEDAPVEAEGALQSDDHQQQQESAADTTVTEDVPPAESLEESAASPTEAARPAESAGDESAPRPDSSEEKELAELQEIPEDRVGTGHTVSTEDDALPLVQKFPDSTYSATDDGATHAGPSVDALNQPRQPLFPDFTNFSPKKHALQPPKSPLV